MQWLKFIKKMIFFGIFFVLLLCFGVYFYLQHTLPKLDGEIALATLNSTVTIDTDHYGVPKIQSANRLDAIRGLGFANARDRLFQMDLMRRQSAGRLSEILGKISLSSDSRARVYGFNVVSEQAYRNLSTQHQKYLEAYAQGVNSYLDLGGALPYEFILLNYKPEPWRPADSLMIVLAMVDILTSGAESEERMLSVMQHSLPNEVFNFLTPDTDSYTNILTRGNPSWRPETTVPVEQLIQLQTENNKEQQKVANLFKETEIIYGSNAWVISGSKTKDGRAILANDMHLPIAIPNIWYRAELHYEDTNVAGVNLPGTPLLIAGSNDFISWGITNLTGDFLDLVSLETDTNRPDEYKVHDGWQHFQHRQELIAIKDAAPEVLDVKSTIWGPVSPTVLLGKQVAVHWTALDSSNVNIGLVDMESTKTLESAIDRVHQVGGPQLNMLLADRLGNIAWTIMGKIPRRIGFDGSISYSWLDGYRGWQDYVQNNEIPVEINPAEGYLVSANDRRLGKNFPYVIGHQFVSGYRALRITETLKPLQAINETQMYQLQLDTKAEFYHFYQQLALEVLSDEMVADQPELQKIKEYLLAWDGKADIETKGLALLINFRNNLGQATFSWILSNCKKYDEEFFYSWLYFDTPLQQILKRKIPEILPQPEKFHNWNNFIIQQLKESMQQLYTESAHSKLTDLRWGLVNRVEIKHPIFGEIPFLGYLLNMPEDESAGCGGCVRAAGPGFGASERMVVSPGHQDQGFLQIPQGQSANPVSKNYIDQQNFWLRGIPLPFLSQQTNHHLRLIPN